MSYNVYNKETDSLEVVSGRVGDAIEKVIERTLKAGQTVLDIKDDDIGVSSMIDVYTNLYGVIPNNIETISGMVRIKFPPQIQDIEVRVTVGVHAIVRDVSASLEEVIEHPYTGIACSSNALAQACTYSSQEILVGKVNNRKLYRKMFEFTDFVTNTNRAIDLPSNAENIRLNANSYGVRSDNWVSNGHYISSTDYLALLVNHSEGSVWANWGTKYPITKLVFIVEYMKVGE